MPAANSKEFRRPRTKFDALSTRSTSACRVILQQVEDVAFHARHCEPRFAASALHRAITSVYCSLAFLTASTCLAVGATSASCIAIAAAIIAARTLSKVGGPVGAWRNPNPGLVPRVGGGAIESICDFNAASLALVSRSDIARAVTYAARSATAPSYISRERVATCAIADAGVFTRGSSTSLRGCVWVLPSATRRTVYAPAGAQGVV